MIRPLLALGLPGGIDILFLLILAAFYGVFTVLPFWFIFRKAGFHPALSILTIIPIASVAVLFYLAFATWPNHKTIS